MLETKFLFILMEGKRSQNEDILFMAYNPQTGNILPAAPRPTSPELLRPASTLEGLSEAASLPLFSFRWSSRDESHNL